MATPRTTDRTGFEWQYLGQEPFQRDCERIWAVIAGEVGRRQDMGLKQCGIFGEESARNF